MRRAVRQTYLIRKKKVATFFVVLFTAISTSSGGGGSRNNSVDADPKGKDICLLYTSPSPRD